MNNFVIGKIYGTTKPFYFYLVVGAMLNIKSKYEVQENWQGDPCSPKTYMWDGVDCNFNDRDSVRIISL